ncbi:MAG: L-threonylcarbamoyladenylate synthase [Bacteroidota bacterium]|jgi:tRNA threonylcarbamoyl adenosine modification protein (Sua5/YciO/YrdC/YwlC family)
MYLRLNPDKPDFNLLDKAVDSLLNGGVIIYPTDTVYALGCSVNNQFGVERIAKIKKIPIGKNNFSIVCHDLSHLSNYTKPIPNHLFRLLKKALPGPYTFILPAGNNLPKSFRDTKKTIGIRVPDNKIISYIVEKLGQPLISGSIHDNEDEILEYYTEPEAIYETYKDQIDLMVDGGYGNIHPSTVIDCTGEIPIILREGLGDISFLN